MCASACADPAAASSPCRLLPQVGPPPAYSPYNCKPECVRMTSYAVPNSQASCTGGMLVGRIHSACKFAKHPQLTCMLSVLQPLMSAHAAVCSAAVCSFTPPLPLAGAQGAVAPALRRGGAPSCGAGRAGGGGQPYWGPHHPLQALPHVHEPVHAVDGRWQVGRGGVGRVGSWVASEHGWAALVGALHFVLDLPGCILCGRQPLCRCHPPCHAPLPLCIA